MTVNLEKMLLMLNNVFTLPRSYRSMEGLRTAASDYISQKLGNLGLIVGIQYFFPSRFYHQVIYFYQKTVGYKKKKISKNGPFSNFISLCNCAKPPLASLYLIQSFTFEIFVVI